MKIVKGNYGECRFCDNMDEDNGLPSLEDKSWDLCLTDPPYNINAKANSQAKGKSKTPDIGYKDYIDDYSTYIEKIINLIFLKTSKLIITIGQPNIGLYFRKFGKPREILYHYKPNGAGISALCWQNLIEPIFCYGDWFGKKPWTSNIFKIHLKNGFLREKERFVHPHPKETKLWFELCKGESVLDPFMGSGTTAEVCESLGLPWLGYELMEEYSPDIEKRIQRGILKKKHAKKQHAKKQQTLFPVSK